MWLWTMMIYGIFRLVEVFVKEACFHLTCLLLLLKGYTFIPRVDFHIYINTIFSMNVCYVYILVVFYVREWNAHFNACPYVWGSFWPNHQSQKNHIQFFNCNVAWDTTVHLSSITRVSINLDCEKKGWKF